MLRPPLRPLAALSIAALLALLGWGAGCAPSAEDAGEAPPPIDLESYRLVDLTYPFDERTVYWPTATSGFELEEVHFGKTEAGFFYAANRFSAPEHGGTHLDAPLHFHQGRQDAAQVPLERLVGPAVVIDVSEKAAEDPDYRLTPDDVAAFETEHGTIPEGTIVLLRTGWGERWWGDRAHYLGDDTPGDASNLHFPAYGVEAARLLVEERGVAALGLDTASLDYGASTEFEVHQVAAVANVPGLENVANLQELPVTGAWVMALPMKISGGSGGPVRIAALVPRPSREEPAEESPQ